MQTKTKIIATLGPACADENTITELVEQGVDMFRLNFSHGTLEEHAEMLSHVNRARANFPFSIGILADLCGPKIRITELPAGESVSSGDTVRIVSKLPRGTAARFGTNYPDFYSDVSIGQRVLIDDGQIELKITDKQNGEVICEVITGGDLKSRKGINLPDTDISTPAITERDWQCVNWAMDHGVDYLALSFVQSSDEITWLKNYLIEKGSLIRVVAKIEKPQAVENLQSIVNASDAVLVARGDLGVEMDLARVPLIQKQITRLCRKLGKPVIVATQMLQSMIKSPTATRAEVSDVANAIMDFTDAVMLSGETAVGEYPVKAIQTIEQIGEVTEAWLDSLNEPRPRIETHSDLSIDESIARSVAQIVDDMKAKMVVVWCQTGCTARLLSKARIDVPILALCADREMCREMSLHYGVIPVCRTRPRDFSQFADLANKVAQDNGWAKKDDTIILLPTGCLLRPNSTKAIVFHTVQ
ncbi:Pyruvate kinase [Anaerohalosphaera lusitana]|uniref:Pyruvate kinase n=1 Tax=Anaerohalosphaera lusitana TaxID=1936003 RepID=A0A1U9NKD6_9BACT|nr:pyruvate kinase [Anaerohalosphaera lusitana]AQT68381.1 Pyruvate kinase [Anaerohalosphaera lusitana]